MLRTGSRGAHVVALQRRLAELGWYDGEADGVYGELTEDAVRALQRAFRLHVDGVAGREVQRLLRDPLLSEASAPARRLVVGWGETFPAPGRAPSWLSAWASPWFELSADFLGRIDPGEIAARVTSAAGASPPRSDGAATGPWLPIVTVRPSPTLVPLRGRSPASPVRAVQRQAPLGRVIVAPAGEPPASGRAGAAELPPPGAFRLARWLQGAGAACWLSLRLLAPGRPASLEWWGFEVARRTDAFERLIVWTPGLDTDLEPALSAVRAAMRGIRRWRPLWQVLLGMDLSPWLVEPGRDADGKPVRRRLTRDEAVLVSWQLRLRRLRGESAEELPVLLRCTPERVRAFVRLVQWAGLGGMVLQGVDQADAPVLTAIESRLSPFKFSSADDPS